MKIIVNKFIPFHGYIAMAFFNMIFWRKEYEWIMNTYRKDIIVNHESIHVAQMEDFCNFLPIGGLIFYIIYICEWIGRLFVPSTFMSFRNAYMNLSFEKEARSNEKNKDYLLTRKTFSQWS